MRFSWLIIGGSILAMMVLTLLLLQLQRRSGMPQGERHASVYCAAGMVPLIESSRNIDSCPASFQIERSGGSGELAGQATLVGDTDQGVDLLILADADLLQQLHQQGIVVETLPLARQKPVLAVRKEAPRSVNSLTEALADDSIRLGIGAEHSAIGRMTRQYARQHGQWRELNARAKMQTENVMTLAQALMAGSLDVVIVWDTTVAEIQRHQSDAIHIAAPLDATDRQQSEIGIGITPRGMRHPAARQLALWWTESLEHRTQLQLYGYQPAAGTIVEPAEQPR